MRGILGMKTTLLKFKPAHETKFWVYYSSKIKFKKIPFTHEDQYSFKLRLSLKKTDYLNEEKRNALIAYLKKHLTRDTFYSFKIANPHLWEVDIAEKNIKKKKYKRFINRFDKGGQFTIYIRNDYDEAKLLDAIINLEIALKKLGLKPGKSLLTDLPVTEFIQIRLARIDNQYISSKKLMKNEKALAKNKNKLEKSFLYQFLRIDKIIIEKFDELITYGESMKRDAGDRIHSKEYKEGKAIVTHASKLKTMIEDFIQMKDKQAEDYEAFAETIMKEFENMPAILKGSVGWRKMANYSFNVSMLLMAPAGIGLFALTLKKSVTGSFFFSAPRIENPFDPLKPLNDEFVGKIRLWNR